MIPHPRPAPDHATWRAPVPAHAQIHREEDTVIPFCTELPLNREQTAQPAWRFPIDWGRPCWFAWRPPRSERTAFWRLDNTGAPWRWW